MWWLAVATIFSALALTGCPLDFGKGGFVDKASHKDTGENMLELTGCSAERRWEVCDGPNKDPDACEKCGGP